MFNENLPVNKRNLPQVSTNRIKDFLELPESYNDANNDKKCSDTPNDQNEAFTDISPEANPLSERDEVDIDVDDNIFDDNRKMPSAARNQEQFLMNFKNAAFSWKIQDFQNFCLEIDELHIPTGKKRLIKSLYL